MPWTVVDDNGTFQVRASIDNRDEMNALIACLDKKKDALPEKKDERPKADA